MYLEYIKIDLYLLRMLSHAEVPVLVSGGQHHLGTLIRTNVDIAFL